MVILSSEMSGTGPEFRAPSEAQPDRRAEGLEVVESNVPSGDVRLDTGRTPAEAGIRVEAQARLDVLSVAVSRVAGEVAVRRSGAEPVRRAAAGLVLQVEVGAADPVVDVSSLAVVEVRRERHRAERQREIGAGERFFQIISVVASVHAEIDS